MRLRLSIVDPARGGEGPHDVLLEAPSGVRFGDIRARLASLVHDGADQFVVDGRVVSDDDVVGTGSLVRGALLTAHRSPAAEDTCRGMPLGSGALLALHVVGGPSAGRTIPLRRGEQVLGRAASNPIRVDDAGVSRAHCVVSVSDNGVHVRDLDPTNATTLDGEPVPRAGCVLSPGARMRVASTTLMLRHVDTTPVAKAAEDGVVRFNRRPRFVIPVREATIRFPPAPERAAGVRAPVVASLAPLVLSVALATVLRSPAILLFALMSPVMLLGQWWADRRQGRLSHRSQVAMHARQTEGARQMLRAALHAERVERHEASPDLALLGVLATRHDSRLWERRPGDPDHLVLRIGTGSRPSRVVIEHNGLNDGLHDACGEQSSAVVRDVPVTVDLDRHPVLGVAGPRARVLSVVGGLLAQVAVWHSPRSVRVSVLTTARDAASTWAWAARLPHALGGTGGPIALVASSDDPAALRSRVDELSRLAAARLEATQRSPRADVLPRFVLVLDGAGELRATPGVSDLLAGAAKAGIRVLCIDESPALLPAETAAQVVLDGGPVPGATLDLPGETVADVTPDLPSAAWLESVSRRLACLEDATPEERACAIPASVGFAAAHAELDVDPTTVDGVVRAWSSSDGCPAAVIGVTAEGPLRIDLAQDGPHCLVGGTTGAGKSELLQTLVAGLAVGSRPDELGFVLVDYKGGSAFSQCARLPHTLGVVTDLDEQLTARALVSLGAELKRREAALARVGAKDIADYRRRRILEPGLPPLPRLVLVVDEFKLLADELPDFVEGLVRIAAVGRSLGVHLVLATQRPAGIITGDMRANIALRIALRVRDRADSDDVVESPVAAGISDRAPGRAWLRTAGDRLVEVQTAYVGAAMERPNQGRGGPASNHVLVRRLQWEDLARPVPAREQPGRPPAGASRPTAETELAAVVEATRAASARLTIPSVPSPWLPPLPEVLAVDDLATGRPLPRGRADLPASGSPRQSALHLGRADLAASKPPWQGAIPFGLEDCPEAQSQVLRTWHPMADGNLGVAGSSRTGRSSLLRTIAAGIAERWSPSQVHLHVLEGTPGNLTDLAELPHVGSVTGSGDPSLAARVVRRLADQLHSTREGGEAEAAALPAVVLLVDGWEPLEEAFDAVDHGLPAEELLRLTRDGHASGLRVVVTGGRALVSGRLAGLLQERLVLPMLDPLDLTLAGLSPADAETHRTVGRAIDVATGHRVQLAHVGADPSLPAQRSAIALVAGLATAGCGPDTVRHPWRMVPLPSAVPWDRLSAADSTLLAVGLGGDEAQPVGFPPGRDQRRILVTGPPRSGRSTTLAAIVRQLANAGHPTVVVVSRRSPLTQLGGLPGVDVLGPEDVASLQDLRARHRHLAVVVDDADALDGTPVEPLVLDLLRDESGWLAASVDSRRAPGLYRGLVPELSHHETGIVLSPASPTEGDLLGVRVEVPRYRQPGRGYLIVEGQATPVQVADALALGPIPAGDGR